MLLTVLFNCSNFKGKMVQFNLGNVFYVSFTFLCCFNGSFNFLNANVFVDMYAVNIRYMTLFL